MIVRSPKFDFSQTTPHWAPNHEFAHMFNGMSMLFPPLERFLNRVMATARGKITGKDAKSVQVRADIAMFIRQEGVHYSIHTAFNDMLERHGYPDLPKFEAEMEEFYRELLRTKSLKQQLAFCEGFEILGPIYAHIWLDEIGDLFEGGDPDAVAMWKWHIAEEFEHRTVCFDTYNLLYGGYLTRLNGLKEAGRAHTAYVKRVMNYMLARDWATMSEAEVAASKARLAAVEKRIKRLAMRRIWRVFVPFYSPRQAVLPSNYDATLGAIERRYVANPA
jgi:hypothetical protein